MAGTCEAPLLKGALVALVLAAGLLASPRLVPDAYGLSGTCTSPNCKLGSCSAIWGEGETCSCTCNFMGAPECRCRQLRPTVDG
ncbi:MAG TPA: hypothetical protein VHG28_25200 [Longimicrobiaceae bacterium]|nr:hypothetical protein [Longimicrobiaceae bacterium]